MAEASRRRDRSLGVRSILFMLMAIGSITPCIAECNTTQWWTDPCKTEVHVQMEKFRHGRSVKEHRGFVMEQLRGSINRSRGLLKDLGRLYINETHNLKYHRQNLQWLNVVPMIRNISHPRRFERKLRKLHTTLQYFAGALEVLSCTPIKSPGYFDKVKRDKILYDAKNNLRALICEVKLAVPNQTTRKIPLEKMGITLPSEMNLTESFFYDLQVLKNLKWFLTQLKNKALKGKKGPRNRNRVLEIRKP
ncbi:uncharacterized protein LOC123684916 isoform X2 [Harmonia axyridis]|uniref:uncharacterized protein LOC123684916 isoform X2 n=1 Tax=Harmonia axyridis TaxID=115357 RepID=UPI001E2788A7|nr:uncharacterized protein LOC123684916 isoform X2 [Harmonia axyridis]